jgi:hypothetical protein
MRVRCWLTAHANTGCWVGLPAGELVLLLTEVDVGEIYRVAGRLKPEVAGVRVTVDGASGRP